MQSIVILPNGGVVVQQSVVLEEYHTTPLHHCDECSWEITMRYTDTSQEENLLATELLETITFADLGDTPLTGLVTLVNYEGVSDFTVEDFYAFLRHLHIELDD